MWNPLLRCSGAGPAICATALCVPALCRGDVLAYVLLRAVWGTGPSDWWMGQWGFQLGEGGVNRAPQNWGGWGRGKGLNQQHQ